MPSLPEFSRSTDRRKGANGAALILVLIIIVLAAALVVAFMASVRNDLVSVSYYKAGKEAMALGETASGIVMSQIREATLSGIGGDGVGTQAWASQPGAIRVWDNQGNLVQLYKLYSASRMKETGMSFLETEVPEDWDKRPDEYVNLNEPVASGSGSNLFWNYPILSPDALGTVSGLASTQTAPGGATVFGDPRVSMPVRWLYVGRDGNLSDSLQSDSVGRIAFWTDDETCKININTASATASNSTIGNFPPGSSTAGSETKLGYSYWDVPHTQLVEDWNLARGALSQGEYQRYAGHPASVNLLTVLSGTGFDALSEATKKQTLKDAFALFPAYRWGGSENSRIPWTQGGMRIPLSGTNQKSERLYASVDELCFKPSLSGDHREENDLPVGTGDKEKNLSSWRFLLTTSSRAPDLNLFGQPRVAIWPLSDEDDARHRTTQDNLIALCSTYGPTTGAGKKYYFTRKDALSQTADWSGLPRNQELFAYLQAMTSREIPGFGGNFLAKYDGGGGAAGERDQILTEIFDYIRCVNLNEASDSKPADYVSYTPTIDVPAAAATNTTVHSAWCGANYMSFRGAGMVLPILINQKGVTTRGAGRVPVLSEVAFFAMQATKSASSSDPSGEIQTALFFETFSPMQGYMPWTPLDFQLSVKTAMTVAGQPVFPDADKGVTTPPINRSMSAWSFDAGNQPIGGTDGFAWTSGTSLATYAFARDLARVITLPPPPATGLPKLEISQANVAVDLTMNGVSYQHCEVEFPAASLPVPDASTLRELGKRRTAKGINFLPEDVVHSIVPKDGDYRIMAYLQNVPQGFFHAHTDYGTTKHFAHSLRSRRNWGQKGTGVGDGTTNGSFAPFAHTDAALTSADSGSENFWTDRPDIPPDITDLVAKGWTGDWNNGIGDFPDGAYLGKADDGLRSVSSSGLYLGTEYNWYSGAGFFSPTQQMPSAVMFGSLPTGVKRTEAAYKSGNDANAVPWRTLLFCKNPAVGGAHYGAVAPQDSLLLDLFTMPVVEPYAISEPTSTAGRINMNYQILPFTGIERSTALYGLLSSQRITAFPDSIAAIRGGNPVLATQGSIQTNTTQIYNPINAAETLKQFSTRFAQGDIFHSAAEICSLWLVPAGVTLNNTPAWWNTRRSTGDNLRERPYATIYPLLTTKSNTYTVHVWAQSLVPGTKKVTGEYRGSTLIERYVDPMDERLVETAHDPDSHSVEPLYRFRVLEVKRFAP